MQQRYGAAAFAPLQNCMASKVLVSPAGELMWAKVLRPGIANKGKPSEKEMWSVDLLLSKDDAEAQAFVKLLKERFIEAHGTAARPGPNGLPYRTYIDQNGDETQLWVFRFGRNTITSRGQELAPPVVQDAAGNPWPKDVLIGNGSSGRVAFDPWHWTNPEGGKGISCNLQGVRVLHLVEYQAPDPGAAFGEPEKGYVLTGNEARTAEPAAAPAKPAATASAWDADEEIPF